MASWVLPSQLLYCTVAVPGNSSMPKYCCRQAVCLLVMVRSAYKFQCKASTQVRLFADALSRVAPVDPLTDTRAGARCCSAVWTPAASPRLGMTWLVVCALVWRPAGLKPTCLGNLCGFGYGSVVGSWCCCCVGVRRGPSLLWACPYRASVQMQRQCQQHFQTSPHQLLSIPGKVSMAMNALHLVNHALLPQAQDATLRGFRCPLQGSLLPV